MEHTEVPRHDPLRSIRAALTQQILRCSCQTLGLPRLPTRFRLRTWLLSLVIRVRGRRCGRIMALAVSREYRGRGIGRRLMELAEESMIQKGARIFVLGSGSHRNDAQAFYETLGYKFTGRRYKQAV